ncbi:MAG TPA: sensor histidine kinase, partial [Cytophagales bacterium]|nr:sensor histidine kinase [Cytophagales bacterium]
PMLIFFISLRKWHEGNKIARFYIFATTFFLVSVVITCLKVLGLIESTMAQEFMLEIGVAIDAVFISLALGDKLRNLNYEKNMAKEKERVAIADKERLITEQNSVLENKISNRMDEIIQKSYQLEFFSKKIKDQNNLLKKHNENLELQIEERTKQVVLTNTQLKRKTARLEQFTYIVSHNLKSPVRNISTLMDFVQEEKLDMTTKAYFDILKKTNNQLKNIIEDINILVSHDQHTEIELSSVNLPTVVGNIQDKLLIQIIESNCVIDTDFAVSTFMSFPPYITSILYNLINNAIKHRSWDRPIKIHITSYKIEDAIVITVVDNGKGIAAEQLPHVCKLFYKVDNDQEGKGMGLFIVKSQIEQLGGKLHIGSVLNEGTIFEISIPQK